MWFIDLFKNKSVKNTDINMGFWANLPKPIFVMAPMADVTDCAFRQIITKYGKPAVFWTEFVSSNGLCSPGREALMIDLKFSDNERPIVAQIFGADIKNMEDTARLCAELGFDGVDINMGCPDRSVIKQETGVAHIKNPKHAVKIIEAVKRGAPNLPVSVKTRLGFNQIETDKWVPKLLSTGIAVLTMHGRTRSEMSLVPAHWDEIKKVVDIRNQLGVKTLIFGNGDAKNIEDAKQKGIETGVDGVMFGRAIFGNPWLFDENKKEVTVRERLLVMIEHTKLFVQMLGDKKNFAIMKKHYKAYVNGFAGAKELRIELMEAKNEVEIEKLTHEFLDKHSAEKLS
jgi:nifR3 family TIM-barrel protein